MVALEAWALGRPVLANGKCDVLKGQCIRSNAGLYYGDAPEFTETLSAIERNRWLAASLGRNGRQFYREHYDWPVIERKYLDMLAGLSAEREIRLVDPLPGWLERRRQDCPPAASVVAALPAGPVLERDTTTVPADRTAAAPASGPAAPSRHQPPRSRTGSAPSPFRPHAPRGSGA
jgi:hypothetical protein